MTTPLSQTDAYLDFQGLSGLRARARDNQQETLREVAGQFEALFIQMMLKSMRDASLGEGLLDNEHTDTYQSMFDKQISIELSRGKGLGLAELMVRQLSSPGQTDSNKVLPPVPVIPASRVVVKSASASQPVSIQAVDPSATPADWRPESPQRFVQELWPHARRAAQRLGTRPEVLIAQAALETGWGQHMIRGSDGRNSFNLFGIKADSRWQGERVSTETVEFKDGLMRKERAHFRAYASLSESFSDYASFLQNHPRYREVLNAGADSEAFGRALSAAGYATDPDYSLKINRIMQGGRFRDALSTLKEQGGQPLS